MADEGLMRPLVLPLWVVLRVQEDVKAETGRRCSRRKARAYLDEAARNAGFDGAIIVKPTWRMRFRWVS